MTGLAGGGRLGRVALVAVLLCAAPARADVITQWNEQALASGGASRTLAMVHLAMFDAINAIVPRYQPYLRLPQPPAGALAEAAAAGAAYGVLIRLQRGQAVTLEAALASSLAPFPDGDARRRGLLYGDLVADAMYRARLADNILAPGPIYISTGLPGAYQVTTPGPAQPISTNAQNWIPFALTSASQFRPGPPPPLTSKRYADDLAETGALGELGSPYGRRGTTRRRAGTPSSHSFSSIGSRELRVRSTDRICSPTLGSSRCSTSRSRTGRSACSTPSTRTFPGGR